MSWVNGNVYVSLYAGLSSCSPLDSAKWIPTWTLAPHLQSASVTSLLSTLWLLATLVSVLLQGSFLPVDREISLVGVCNGRYLPSIYQTTGSLTMPTSLCRGVHSISSRGIDTLKSGRVANKVSRGAH